MPPTVKVWSLNPWTTTEIPVITHLDTGSQEARASPVAQTVKCLLTTQEAWVQSLGWEGPLEAPVFFPGESPWTEDPGRLQPMESQRVRHD